MFISVIGWSLSEYKVLKGTDPGFCSPISLKHLEQFLLDIKKKNGFLPRILKKCLMTVNEGINQWLESVYCLLRRKGGGCTPATRDKANNKMIWGLNTRDLL